MKSFKNQLVTALIVGVLILSSCSKDQELKPVSHPDWSSYQNNFYHFQIDYPSSWKTNEYKESGNFLGVAFDPGKVVSPEDFGAVDIAPGTFYLYVQQGPPGNGNWEGFTSTSIGKNSYEAKYRKEANGEDASNPWWANRTDRRYYILLPSDNKSETNYLVVAAQYPNDKEGDAALQKQLQDILDSIVIGS